MSGAHTPVQSDSLGQAAVQALGEIGDVAAVETLLAILVNEREISSLRESAAEALGQIGDIRAVEPLVGLLDYRHGIDRAAFKALVQLGEKSVEPLVQFITNNYVDNMNSKAAEALGEIGDSRAVEVLINAMERSFTNSGAAKAYVHALGQLGPSRS